MDATHAHLLVNHAPIIGTFVMVVLLAWGLLRRSRDVIQAALLLAVLLGPVTWAAIETGEAAEEQQERAAWFSEQLVSEHEEQGEVALIGSLVLAGVAMVALWLGRAGRVVPGWILGVAVFGGVAAFGLLARTGLSGGVIRHEEVRPAGARGSIPPADTTSPHAFR